MTIPADEESGLGSSAPETAPTDVNANNQANNVNQEEADIYRKLTELSEYNTQLQQQLLDEKQWVTALSTNLKTAAEKIVALDKEKEDWKIKADSMNRAIVASNNDNNNDKQLSYNDKIKNKKKAKSAKKKAKSSAKTSTIPPATLSQVLSFLPTRRDHILLAIGIFAAVLNGLVYPILAYVFSNSFSELGSAQDGLAQVTEVAYTFLVVGAYAFVVAAIQNASFLVLAVRAADNFKKSWFRALLRQDAAFHDVHSVAGMATALSSASNKMKRGLGRKLGEGIQFGTTFVGGIIYAFYSSWRVALVILALLPLVSFAAYFLMQLNQNQTSNAQKAYTHAGSVSYGAVSSIRTVLSLNAVPEMIRQYSQATMEAYQNGIRPLFKVGFVNGSMLGSFILLYAVLTLYGSYLLYNDVQTNYCDPSGSVPGMETCTSSGPDVFGAMLGVAFAAQGMSQLANSMEALSSARSACAQAMQAIDRKLGSEETVVVKPISEGGNGSKDGKEEEEEEKMEETFTLPKYEIDSSSHHGLKPKSTKGEVIFENVKVMHH